MKFMPLNLDVYRFTYDYFTKHTYLRLDLWLVKNPNLNSLYLQTYRKRKIQILPRCTLVCPLYNMKILDPENSLINI